MIDTGKLLELIQQYNFLYNKSCKDFKDSGKKHNAWKEMAKTLDSEVDVVKCRWRTLRERFSKELKNSQPKSGQSVGEPSTWEWFESMKFLEKFVKPRKTVASRIQTLENSTIPFHSPTQPSTSGTQCGSPINLSSDDDDFDGFLASAEGNSASTVTSPTLPRLVVTPTTSTKKRKRIPSKEDGFNEKILATLETLKNNESEDEDDLFCRSVACELRKVEDPEEKKRRKAKIFLIATGLQTSFDSIN